MSINELDSKVAQLQEWQQIIAEAEAEAEAIKAQMAEQGTEELQTERHIIRWTTIISNIFDSSVFKKVMPDVYKSFTKPTTSRRFSIS